MLQRCAVFSANWILAPPLSISFLTILITLHSISTTTYKPESIRIMASHVSPQMIV